MEPFEFAPFGIIHKCKSLAVIIWEKSKKNSEFPVTDMWANIVKDAHHVLDEIVPNQNQLRDQLEEKVEQALQNNKNIMEFFYSE